MMGSDIAFIVAITISNPTIHYESLRLSYNTRKPNYYLISPHFPLRTSQWSSDLFTTSMASSSTSPFWLFVVYSFRRCSIKFLLISEWELLNHLFALTCSVSFSITTSCSLIPRLLPIILSASLRASWKAKRNWTAWISHNSEIHGPLEILRLYLHQNESGSTDSRHGVENWICQSHAQVVEKIVSKIHCHLSSLNIPATSGSFSVEVSRPKWPLTEGSGGSVWLSVWLQTLASNLDIVIKQITRKPEVEFTESGRKTEVLGPKKSQSLLNITITFSIFSIDPQSKEQRCSNLLFLDLPSE